MATKTYNGTNSGVESPLDITVVTRALESMDHCSHCQVFIDQAGLGSEVHRADLMAYPSDVQAEYRQVSDIVIHLLTRFAPHVRVRVVNALSPDGLWLALRRGIRRYPTWLIGPHKIMGTDEHVIMTTVAQMLEAEGKQVK